mgnify:FL=1|tara:strand:+ start:591 stop:1484 length:894 start_codon:yes stop_codon:yes gene_type:complete
MSSYNRRSSSKLGWTPQWFGVPEFGEDLQDSIKDFQGKYTDLKIDGMCGPVTFRRVKLERDAEDIGPASGDKILLGGKLLPIPWDNVVVPREDGALTLSKGFRKRKDRYINMVITHWDVCTSAKKCRNVLAAKGISTHFCIDWDGTIYQFVDAMHEAWHSGVGKINRQSIGIDLNNPVYTKYNKVLVKRGQPERPVINGYSINGWKPKEFLGFHQVQIDAYIALLAGLNEHLPDLNLVPTGDLGNPKVIKTIPLVKAASEGGVMHHAHVKKRKWDTAGVDIAACCEAAKGLDVLCCT